MGTFLLASGDFHGKPDERFKHYLPQVLLRGRCLLFTRGIYALTGFTAVILILFGGVTDPIPLYAIGAFLAFTLSQAGLVKHCMKKDLIRLTGINPPLVVVPPVARWKASAEKAIRSRLRMNGDMKVVNVQSEEEPSIANSGKTWCKPPFAGCPTSRF